MTLLPTHRCFDDAAEFILYASLNVRNKKKVLKEYKIVHGICKLANGTLYAHAWVEHKGKCIFKGIIEGEEKAQYLAADTAGFYQQFQVQETTKYTIEEAMRLSEKIGSSGPFKPEYKVLCANGDKRKWDDAGNLYTAKKGNG